MENEYPIIFSIIIPATRDLELKRLLSGLSKQSFDLSKIEVILIYNHSRKIDLNYPINLITLFSEKNHPGIKRNIGCKNARGKYYAFLDDDCFPNLDWLEHGFRLLQRYEIVCGPCSLNEGPFARRLARAIGSSFFGSGNRICCNYKEAEVPFYNVGFYNIFMHRHIWELANGCNEEANFLMDDKEFFYLLSLRGLKFYNSPDIEVSHSARTFPIDFLKYSFKRKFQTGINFFIYREIFLKQKVFYFIYASYLFIPSLFLLSRKLFLILLLFYYLFLSAAYLPYQKKDFKVYLFLPLCAILTNIAMLSGILCGSLYFILHRNNFKKEIIAERRRITRALSYAQNS